MIIGIIPAVKKKFKNQLELSIEPKLLSFIKSLHPKSKIKILYEKKKEKFDYLVISGGNDLIKHKLDLRNITRNKLNNFHHKIASANKIPILGICHGAHFIANKHGALFKKSKNHVGSHQISFFNGKKKIILSHHKYVISRLSSNFKILALAKDKTIEFFKLKNKKIYGVIWHPERQKKISKFEKNLFKRICI